MTTALRAWSRRSVAAAGLAAALLAGGATPALAALGQSPAPSFQTDDTVHAMVRVGGVIYIAGAFLNVRPAGSPPDTNETPRQFVAAFNESTGDLMQNWTVSPNATVRSLAVSSTGKGIILGGDFTTVDGQTHKHLARVRACLNPSGDTCGTGSTLAAWNAHTNGSVYAITSAGSRVFVGGNFTTIDGVRHRSLGAVNLTSGAVLKWTANANGEVRALLKSPAGTRIFAGGTFTKIGRQNQSHLTVLNASTAKILPWAQKPAFRVKALALDAKNVYVAGAGRGGFIEADGITRGKLHWRAQADGNIIGVAVSRNILMATGHFRLFGSKHFPRVHLAALSAATGKVDQSWVADENQVLGGFSVLGSRDHVWAGGDFTKVSGVDQQGFAQFDWQ
jgi:Domain of unknown function (DUF5122) beta-propeller